MENYPTTEGDEFSSWEIIPKSHQLDNRPSLNYIQPEGLNLNLSVKDDFYTTDDRSLFPLKNHNFHHHQGLESDQTSAEEYSKSMSSSSEDDEFPGEVDGESSRPDANKIGTKLRHLGTVIVMTTSNLYSHLKVGDKFWSFALKASIVSATVVSLVYARMIWQHNRVLQESRNRLLVLLREKDRKISQLLMRITQLNEIVSARRRIPVVQMV